MVFAVLLTHDAARDLAEIFFKPYRIISRIMDKNVYVLLMVDGRRDMQSLLQRRLLNG